MKRILALALALILVFAFVACNAGENDEFVSFYDFDCYADGKNCEQAYFRDDSLSATLSAGRKAQGTVTFIVPDNASTVEVEYVSNAWTSSRVIFTVNK